MKIMISSDGPHAHFYIRVGWIRVFQSLGHDAILWDIGTKSSFDAFDEFEPDIFIGQTYNLDRGVFSCIKERPHLKVVLRASDWGDMQKEIDLEKYPVLVARADEKKILERLKKETDTPHFVYNHYHQNHIEKTHNEWRNIGIEPVSMLHAADIFSYANGLEDSELTSDVSFVGGYWPYKAQSLDKYMLRLCHPVGRYNIKIYGSQSWPVIQHAGRISDHREKNVYRSATISPNISEPHSQDFGYDIIERPFKVLMSGGFCISDYVESMAHDVFSNGEIVYAKTPEEFEELIKHFLRFPEERTPYIKNGYKTVINKHTYFHRVSRIFKKLNMLSESKKCMDLFQSLLSEKVKKL